MRDLAAARCRAPKTAKGAAKHRLLKATTLSRPWARAISVFAVHRATMKSRTPAAHIDGTVRENSRNAAKMEVSTWMPNEALSGRVFPGQYSFKLYNDG